MHRGWAAGGRSVRSGALTRTTAVGFALMAGLAIGGRAEAVRSSLTDAVLSGAFGGTFVWLALHDAATRIIPNRVLYPAAALATALCWGWDARPPIALLAGGALAFGGIAGLSWLAGGRLGGGDVKMGTLVGLVVGYENLPLAATVTVLSGGVAAVVLLAAGRVGRNGSMAYAPFIALGGIVALLR